MCKLQCALNVTPEWMLNANQAQQKILLKREISRLIYSSQTERKCEQICQTDPMVSFLYSQQNGAGRKSCEMEQSSEQVLESERI